MDFETIFSPEIANKWINETFFNSVSLIRSFWRTESYKQRRLRDANFFGGKCIKTNLPINA